MRILYVALKESLPGAHGGAVHVLEVARGLTRRGHTLTVVVQPAPGQRDAEMVDGFEVRRMRAPSKYLLFRLAPRLRTLVAQRAPDVIMERYYNFAGAGIQIAAEKNLASVLEVNAPLVDPPGSAKARADKYLRGWMEQRALAQARAATRIVTPLAATVPRAISRAKICEIAWGANVDLFNRDALDPARLEQLRAALNPRGKKVVAFLGSFRPWHGVREFAQVARALAPARADLFFMMIGAGELLDEIRAFVRTHHLGERVILTGAVPYEQVPYYLALAQVGIAPFNTRAHTPLRVGFYWSPLKVHEYMAMALPVVTLNAPGLTQIVRDGREGLLYNEGKLDELRAAILKLADDENLARQLGANARARVVAEFSWEKHAEKLERVLEEARAVVR